MDEWGEPIEEFNTIMLVEDHIEFLTCLHACTHRNVQFQDWSPVIRVVCLDCHCAAVNRITYLGGTAANVRTATAPPPKFSSPESEGLK